MIRLLKYSVITLFVLSTLSIGFVYFKRVELAEKYLSKKLDAEVHIEDVGFGLRHLSIHGLLIKTRGAQVPYLFKADEIAVTTSPLNLFKEEIEIENVKIDSPTFGVMLFNRSGSENSLQTSLNDTKLLPKKKYKIDQLKLINLQFSASLTSGRGVTLPTLPYLELHNVKALSFKELQTHLFEKIVEKQPGLASLFKDLRIDEGEIVKEVPLLDEVKRKADSLIKSIKKHF